MGNLGNGTKEIERNFRVALEFPPVNACRTDDIPGSAMKTTIQSEAHSHPPWNPSPRLEPVRVLVMAAASVVLGSATAFSQSTAADDASPPPREHHRERGESWLDADSDGNGVISAAEFEALERIQALDPERRARLFNRLDKNHDGALSTDELGPPRGGRRGGSDGEEAGPPRPEGERHRGPRGMRARMDPFPGLDTNGDQAISMAEFLAGPMASKLPPERATMIFARLDTNGDGVISSLDHPEPPARPPHGAEPREPRNDRPADEHPRRFDPERWIKDLDRSGDGTIDSAEFDAIPWIAKLDEEARAARFAAMDRDGDGAITLADFPKPERPSRRDGSPEKHGERAEEQGTRPPAATE